MKLSVCTIMRDEAANVKDLAACLPLREIEWVVVDTGSTDGTQKLLEEMDLEVHSFSWCDDFSAARNHSLDKASRDWILWLDADDRLDPRMWTKIKGLISNGPGAFRFNVSSPRDDGSGDVFRQLRLFHRSLDLRFEGRIHEQLTSSAERQGVTILDTQVEIRHEGYREESRRKRKRERNFQLLEKEFADHPDDPAVVLEWGNCLGQLGRFEAALSAYRSLLPVDPSAKPPRPEAETLRAFPELIADTYEKMGREKDALPWYLLAFDWEPDAPKPAYWLAHHALREGDLSKALSLFRRIVSTPARVSRVARDLVSVRRNALAFLVSSEIELKGVESEPLRAYMEELVAGDLRHFPLEPAVVIGYFRDKKDADGVVSFCERYLAEHPGESDTWVDYLEALLMLERPLDLLSAIARMRQSHPVNGTAEALAGKAREALGLSVDEIYRHYWAHLQKFPADPSLRVFFADWVNRHKLHQQCYADLKSMRQAPPELMDFLIQLENLGHGKGE